MEPDVLRFGREARRPNLGRDKAAAAMACCIAGGGRTGPEEDFFWGGGGGGIRTLSTGGAGGAGAELGPELGGLLAALLGFSTRVKVVGAEGATMVLALFVCAGTVGWERDNKADC